MANLHEKTGTNPTFIDWEKAEFQIKKGMSCAEADKPFEALAYFTIAKDCVSSFRVFLNASEGGVFNSLNVYCIYIYGTDAAQNGSGHRTIRLGNLQETP